nr:MAG TPA: hypothetical protein [Bacteriophage sp.]DAH35531.1 MAG TPA: hypothetical protein [Caudoviricetes sp.]
MRIEERPSPQKAHSTVRTRTFRNPNPLNLGAKLIIILVKTKFMKKKNRENQK